MISFIQDDAKIPPYSMPVGRLVIVVRSFNHRSPNLLEKRTAIEATSRYDGLGSSTSTGGSSSPRAQASHCQAKT